jgi:hypothetical protein
VAALEVVALVVWAPVPLASPADTLPCLNRLDTRPLEAVPWAALLPVAVHSDAVDRWSAPLVAGSWARLARTDYTPAERACS